MAELDLLSMSLAELANSGPIPPAHQSPNASYTPARVTIEDMVEARASFAEPSVTVSAAVGAATAVAAAACREAGGGSALPTRTIMEGPAAGGHTAVGAALGGPEPVRVPPSSKSRRFTDASGWNCCGCGGCCCGHGPGTTGAWKAGAGPTAAAGPPCRWPYPLAGCSGGGGDASEVATGEKPPPPPPTLRAVGLCACFASAGGRG